MRKTTTSISLILFGFLSIAQNISSFSVLPTNPTTNDSVRIIADLQFPYSACALSSKSHQKIGFNIIASTHHCMGIATAICNISDTFNLGQLAAGNYSFDLFLTSGSGPAPCSPGIIPNDNDTLFFIVKTATGLNETFSPMIQFYPNPTTNGISLIDDMHQIQKIKIISLNGLTVLEKKFPRNIIDLGGLSSGLYYVELIHSKGSIIQKLVKQ